MTLRGVLDSPLSWAIVGFAIGAALGVNSLSVWLVVAGLAGFLVNMRLRGAVEQRTEGWLFASGPVFIVAWLAGFVVRGVALG